jgi:spore maturation protein CgeB
MKIVVFGLTVSSSWGNGHATLWRALGRALGEAGHALVFFERDMPYYAQHRDGLGFRGCDLRLYASWTDVLPAARREAAGADLAIVTSYCPDAAPATDLVLSACRGTRAFYDLDTPVTLDRLDLGERPSYVPAGAFGEVDLVLSFAGGHALDALVERLGAREAVPLYGSVDPRVHHPAAPDARFAADLAYLGTYAADRQGTLDELLLAPARRLPARRFLLGGAQYPPDLPWEPNVLRIAHVPPREHPAFFSSCALSLNVTRGPMVRWGWCPSGRLFEAAACGAPQVTDAWEGLEAFFEPGREILVACRARDVEAALARPRAELEAIGRAARERVLAEHTAAVRARELVAVARGDRPAGARRAPEAKGRGREDFARQEA